MPLKKHFSNTIKQHKYRQWVALSLLFISPNLWAEPFLNPAKEAANIDLREQQRQQERERELQRQNTPVVDTQFAQPDLSLPDYPQNETPCFTINTIRLEGDSAADFQWALKAVNDAKGLCLGGQGVLLALNKVQNAILEKGYVTTRVMAQEQDLTQGELVLMLQPGRINAIRFDEGTSWRGRLWNAIPASSGDILNLRDIEQGLENFKRVPNVIADIRIEPAVAVQRLAC